ncbi:MAG: tetratricopeptide repeat protein [Fimbriimonadaceae bacterium]|nr:tetratricopeptide repeat protein [Fimbriimonadaceae bacterium]
MRLTWSRVGWTASVLVLLLGAAAAQQSATLYQSAEAAFVDKQYDKALTTFKQFVERYPDDRLAARALHRIGECHGAQQRFEEAALAFQVCYKRYPDAAVADSAMFNEGFYFFKAQKWQPAAFAYFNYTKKGTNTVYRAQACYWRAEAYYQLGRYEDAVKSYQELLALPAENLAEPTVADLLPYTRYSIAVSLFEAKKYPEALDAAKQVLAKHPQHPVVADALWYGGQALRQAKQLNEAVAWFQRLVDEHAKSALAPDALYAIVEIEQARGRREAAQKAADRLAKEYPGADAQSKNARLRMANERLTAKDYAAAAKLYREALAGASGDAAAAALHGLAEASFELQQWDEAISAYRKLIDQHPRYQTVNRAKLRLGEALLRKGDPAGAETLYRDYLKGTPSGTDAVLARYNLALAVLQQGRKDDAIGLFGEVANADQKGDTGGSALLEVGRLQLEARRFAESRVAYQEFLRRLPTRPEAATAHWGSGEASYGLKDWNRAATAYKALVDGFPKHALVERAYYRLVDVYRALGQMDTANQYSAKLKQLFPTSKLTAATVFASGRERFKAKDYKGAVTAFEQFLKQYPDHEDTPVAKANLAASLYLADGLPDRWKRAALAYADLAKNHPTVAPDALFWAGSAWTEAGDSAQAATALRAFVTQQPTSTYAARAWLLLGKALAAKQPDEAVKAFTACAEAAKDDLPLRSEARSEAAWALLAAGREEAAYTAFEALVADDPTGRFAPEARFHLAGRLHQQKKYAEAVTAYSEWLKAFGTHSLRARVFYNLALAQEAQGQFAGAAPNYQQAAGQLPVADDDLKQQAAYRRGFCLFKAGDPAAALTAFDEFEKGWPKSKLRAEAAYYRGRALLEQDKWAEAATVLQNAINAWPDHVLTASARLNLGLALQNLQKYSEAVAVYQALLKLPDLADDLVAQAQVHLGESLYAQKKHAEALDVLLRAELGKVETVRPAARYWAAMCYNQQGEVAKAREKLQAIINDTPQSEWAQKAKAALNQPGT